MAKGQASRIAVWIILALLIVGLAGFGATNFGGSIRSVATVGDTEIDIDRYGRELQQELRALSAQTGRNIPLSEARNFGVPQAVLGRLVSAAAVEDEARELGLSVGDEEVRRRILEIPAFRGLDGSFDREAYAFVLDQNGMNVAEFEDRIRAETAASIVQSAVTAGVAAPGAYSEAIVGYVAETRDVTWARLSEADLDTDVAEPDEAALAAFHTENAEVFTLPETKAITYAWITPEMLAETVEPDEDLLRQLYDSRLDEYVQPERRLVERLVFIDESAAADAAARLASGEVTFEALVEERGLTLADVDLGDVTQADLGPAGEPVFALSEPGIAGPAPSDLGPALFRVNAILIAREVTFEEAREDLTTEAVIDQARRIITDSLDHFDDLLAGGATLEELASETEMEFGQIDWHSGVTDGIAAYDGFRAAAEQVREGDFPEAIALEEGGVFALRLDEIVAPRLQPLEDVRDSVAEAWRAAEVSRLLTERAEAITEELRAGAEMAGIDLPLGTERGLRRDAFVEGLPDGFVSSVFEMDRGAIRVLPEPGGALIVRLDTVTAPDPSDEETGQVRQFVGLQAAQGMANDVATAFARALQQEKGVSVNEAAINAVHAQFP